MPKPLYFPQPPTLSPSDLRRATTTHWSILAREAEEAIAKHLQLPPTVSVLLVDRCTHALYLCLRYHRAIRGPFYDLTIPRETYRAAKDAAYLAGVRVRYAEGSYPDFNENDTHESWFKGDIFMPTTLGGGAILSDWLVRENVIVDAAHTGYYDMFEFAPACWNALVCLSFFPTKPFGAFGGGAVIGPSCVVEDLRPIAWPKEPLINSSFMYAQGIQALGLIARLSHQEETAATHESWAYVADQLVACLEPHGFRLRWPYVTPHVVSITHSDISQVARLRKLVQSLGYETGQHYIPLDRQRPGEDWVALPFIYSSLPERLAECLNDETGV